MTPDERRADPTVLLSGASAVVKAARGLLEAMDHRERLLSESDPQWLAGLAGLEARTAARDAVNDAKSRLRAALAELDREVDR